jgi:glutathione S-transferase
LHHISPCAKADWTSPYRRRSAEKRLENGEDYLINPKGQVPALLLDDDILLTEGVAIMQYIADRVPDRQLLAPVGTIARYQTLEWLNYVATSCIRALRRCSARIPRKITRLSRARSWRRSCITLMNR